MPENSGRSPLLQHLLELRRVIIICFASIGVSFCVILGFFIDYLMTWITRPIQDKGIQIIYTTMSEALLTKFKVSIVAAVIVSSPVIIWQIWSFIKPGLYLDEQKKCRFLFFVAIFDRSNFLLFGGFLARCRFLSCSRGRTRNPVIISRQIRQLLIQLYSSLWLCVSAPCCVVFDDTIRIDELQNPRFCPQICLTRNIYHRGNLNSARRSFSSCAGYSSLCAL